LGWRGSWQETTSSQEFARAFLEEGECEKHMISEKQKPVRCEPLIDAERAAELLQLHPKTVKKLAQSGVLPGTKIGRVWRFRESSLDAWMSARLQCCGHPSPNGEDLQ